MDKQTHTHAKDTQPYEPPFIEVVEISVEKGFADSTTDFGEDEL